MSEISEHTPQAPDPTSTIEGTLLDAFRVHYQQFVQVLQNIAANPTDCVVLARIGDDLDQYAALVQEHREIFDTQEFSLIETNLSLMQQDVRGYYEEALDASHHGRPVIVQDVYTGRPGRPGVYIDPDFLRWAYTLRSTSGIARFLNVNRQTVRNALLRHGIVQPQANPFNQPIDPSESSHTNSLNQHEDSFALDDSTLQDSQLPQGQIPNDDLLNPNLPLPNSIPSDILPANNPISYTGPLSDLSDIELDDLIRRLRRHYCRAGIAMLDGMLRRLGYRIQRTRIQESLVRIDPVQRVFGRIRIRRRVYSVPGPNSLWHHDGQHVYEGLIRWGIVIHGFIDGYSRLITALQASNNNRGQTVLDLFLRSAAVYGVPSRIRGDHGVENILLAAWMEAHRGTRRGSYIWGRSVHNVRIERLWVDVTAQLGGAWAEAFVELELHHGLNINSVHHIWLLHTLFLPSINQQLSFFAESWNQHRIQIRGGPNRSPADMFGFDMLVHGIRGDRLPETEEPVTDEELEVYGVDWAALRDDRILTSIRENTPLQDGSSSWVGRVGPPEHLNEVTLDPPEVQIADEQQQLFEEQLAARITEIGEGITIPLLWTHGLALGRLIYGNIF